MAVSMIEQLNILNRPSIDEILYSLMQTVESITKVTKEYTIRVGKFQYVAHVKIDPNDATRMDVKIKDGGQIIRCKLENQVAAFA